MRRRIRLVIMSVVLASVGLLFVRYDVESTSPATPPLESEADVAVEAKRPTELLPAPFKERSMLPPVEGEPRPSETAAFCDEANWLRLDVIVERTQQGAFAVEEKMWNAALTSSRVGIASWMSRCHEAGAPIEIVSAASGDLLASYDLESGLRSQR